MKEEPGASHQLYINESFTPWPCHAMCVYAAVCAGVLFTVKWSGASAIYDVRCFLFDRARFFYVPLVVAHLMNNLSIHLVQYVSVSIDWFCLRD